jgi:mono/diheme cytochrome c family protein
VLVILLALSAPVHAEQGSRQYEPEAAALSAEERARAAAAIAADIERARQQQRQRFTEEEQAARDAARALASRPIGARLYEQRCLTCHSKEALEPFRAGWLGWTYTTLRMQWINGATFGSGERAAIVSYLSETRAPSIGRQVLEWVAAVAGLAALGGVARTVFRRHSEPK